MNNFTIVIEVLRGLGCSYGDIAVSSLTTVGCIAGKWWLSRHPYVKKARWVPNSDGTTDYEVKE